MPSCSTTPTTLAYSQAPAFYKEDKRASQGRSSAASDPPCRLTVSSPTDEDVVMLADQPVVAERRERLLDFGPRSVPPRKSAARRDPSDDAGGRLRGQTLGRKKVARPAVLRRRRDLRQGGERCVSGVGTRRMR